MPRPKKNPEPRSNAASGLVVCTGEERRGHTTHRREHGKWLMIRNSKGKAVSISGNTRLADVLTKLTASSEQGISALDFPAGVRLSGLIFKLRRLGMSIETRRQRVPGDPFGARVANYRLIAAT